METKANTSPGVRSRAPEGATFFLDEFIREDEFVCSECNLIVQRHELGDAALMVCIQCVGRAGHLRGDTGSVLPF